MTRSSHDIDAILTRLTLSEKIGQLTMVTAGMAETGPAMGEDCLAMLRRGEAGSVFNLWGAERVAALQRISVEETASGLPLLFGLDVLHGHRTIFPIPLAEAGAFDPALWAATARAAAAEAAADGIDLTFAPMLDVCRDPRWGRIAEGPGEDPRLGALFARAKVAGFQGAGLDDPAAVGATAKHFGAYGAVLAGRDYASVDLSERMLDEVYWPPFRAAAEAGVAAVMPSFNDLAGVPMTANGRAISGLLRGRWGFGGVVVSDYGAVAELIRHGVAADLAEAAALALNAGVDIDMMGDAYRKGLPEALARGLVSGEAIDAAVRRVLALKAALGLLDDPYRRTRRAAPAAARAAPAFALAREAAVRSVVLLKNEGEILPLAVEGGRIAVIGPLAAAGGEMLGPWASAGVEAEAVSPLDGIVDAFPGREVRHAPGVPLREDDASGIAAAADLARGSEVAILCLGESRWMSGEAASRARLGLPGRQEDLARAVLALGRPVVLLLASGRPLCLPWLVEGVAAALAIWFPGSAAGLALGDILSGRASPTGRLAVSWPHAEGQIPVFHARRPTGRPSGDGQFTAKYLDVPTAPLFPFGHGLSYGEIGWEGIEARPSASRPGEPIEVAVTLANRGERAAEETVLLFLRDPVASMARPEHEFRAAARVALGPGERGTARFTLGAGDLSFPGPDGSIMLEPGRFDILAGPSADPDRLLRASIELVRG